MKASDVAAAPEQINLHTSGIASSIKMGNSPSSAQGSPLLLPSDTYMKPQRRASKPDIKEPMSGTPPQSHHKFTRSMPDLSREKTSSTKEHKPMLDPASPNRRTTSSQSSPTIQRSQKKKKHMHMHQRSLDGQLARRKFDNGNMEWDKFKPSRVVRDYAAVSTQNSRFRQYMEDECVAIPNFTAFHNDTADSCFFGVFDGHGGGFCSKFVTESLHRRLSTALGRKASGRDRVRGEDMLLPEEIEECFSKAYHATDEELAKFEEADACGSTAVTCLIRRVPDSAETSFHIANVGDSRAIFYDGHKTQRLTVDHKATNEEEAARIRACNGIIFNKRVGGVVSVTRAFGQTDEKEHIICEPYTTSKSLPHGRCSSQNFLVLASDGISDVLSDEDVTLFVRRYRERGEKAVTICKRMLEEAKEKGAMDNMTVILILLDSELLRSPTRRH